LDETVVKFEDLARSRNPAQYADASKIAAEVHYGNLHPFRWAYIAYIFAAIAMLLMWALNKPKLMTAVWVLTGLGFFFNTYGFGLRMYLMDRAPVSNMYETVIWVAWGSILFAAILEWVYKIRLTLFAGLLVGVVGLVIADF